MQPVDSLICEKKISGDVTRSSSAIVLAVEDLWERDFLIEILPVDQSRIDWVSLPPGWKSRKRLSLMLWLLFQFALGFKGSRHCVLVFSSNETSLLEICLFIRLIQPKVLIHLSDEFGDRADYAQLASEVDLLVRQYHHGKYFEPANVIYMPLGYMTGMLGGQKSTNLGNFHPIADRINIWGFAGNPDKQNRADVLQLFTQWKAGVQVQNISPADMYDLYQNCIFVPSPRGNIRLDCFRLYEASIAGAIPVVAASKEEIADTFCKEESPPWIFADTWKQVIEICQTELESPDLLQQRQELILSWWKARVENVRTRIGQVLQQR